MIDNSIEYIEMCKKAEEIQSRWHPPNGAQQPDQAFTYNTAVYKRQIKGKLTSHFTIYDYREKNPHWLSAIGGKLGLVSARHWETKFTPHSGGFEAVDDTYPGGELGIVNIDGGHRLEDEEWIPQKDLIWLPRQDQLQEMVGERSGYGLLMRLWEFINDYKRSPIATANKWHLFSLEQLWLAFAQHELHQKVWDSAKKEWVKA